MSFIFAATEESELSKRENIILQNEWDGAADTELYADVT